MACILARGFEHGHIGDFDTISASSIVASTTQKRSGGFSVYSGYVSQAAYGIMFLPVAVDEFYLQFWTYGSFATGYSNSSFFKWMNGATVLGSIVFDTATRLLKVYTGDTATLVATGSNLIAANTPYLIEVHVKIANSPDGVIEVRHNGFVDSIFSGDTLPAAITTVDRLLFASPTQSPTYFDDVIANDITGSAPYNTWVAGAYVSGLIPTGAGTTTQWAPSTGANYACVDEIPPVITDYVSINSVNQIDSYEAGNLDASAALIMAVELNMFVQKQGVVTPTKVRGLVRTYATDYPSGTDLTPGLSLSPPLRALWTLNPDTGVAWTPTEVNDMEIGIKSIT